MRKIAKIALEIDHNAAFGGKSKGNKHLSRAVKIALFLCKELKADRNVVEVAAYLHDAALPTKNDENYLANKKLIKDILKKSRIAFDSAFISKVAEAAASHEGTVLPGTLEAKIVHDADVIEKTGILGIIRHTWKMTNHGNIDPENIRDKDIISITDHIVWRQSVLQTALARELAARNNLALPFDTLKKIVPIISKLALQGIITEKIAKKIEPLLNRRQKAALNNQLTLTYLA